MNTRLFTGNKWGTSNPLMAREPDFGIVRLRAFGTYDFRVTDVQRFLRKVAGSDHNFRLDEFADTMRSRMVSVFSDALASSGISVLDAAARYVELGEAPLPLINPVTDARYGIEITSFVVENISVPQEVESAIDQRSSMSAVGNLNVYVKFRLAQGLEKGGAGAGGTAAELALGLAVAQQILQPQGGLTGTQSPAPAVPAAPTGWTTPAELLSPGEVAQLPGVSEGDILQAMESGELRAKKIGSTYRIKRSALEAYLAD